MLSAGYERQSAASNDRVEDCPEMQREDAPVGLA
jgi:hypothetical protein